MIFGSCIGVHNPCKDCKDKRHVGCHSTCEDYAMFRSAVDDKRDMITEGRRKSKPLNPIWSETDRKRRTSNKMR